MIDVETPEGRLFARLARELHDRRTGRRGTQKWSRANLSARRIRPGLQTLDDYRQGDPPLRSDIHSGWKPYVRQFVRMGRLNQADQIISTTSNRMSLRDFRTAAANDELGDVRARNLMRANDLAVVSRDVHDWMLSMGDAYTLTTPPGGRRSYSLITAEDPRQAITGHDPATGEALAGLKMFRDEWDSADLAYFFEMVVRDGAWVCEIQRLRREGSTILTQGPHRLDAEGWELDGDPETVERMPLVRFRNRNGVGEYENHLDHLDRINDKIFDEWWVAKIQAFRQRAVKNLPETTEEVDPETGVRREVDLPEDFYDGMFTASPDEMWRVPADVDFWESAPVDLTPITNAIEKDRSRLASVLSVPLHTVTPDAANGSAEGASTMKEEHVYAVEDRIMRTMGGWARTMGNAFAFSDDPEDRARADATQIEALWGPVERFSLAQKSQAASQAKDSLPREAIQRDIWQYAPAEIPNLRTMSGRDLLFQTPTQGAQAGQGGRANAG